MKEEIDYIRTNEDNLELFTLNAEYSRPPLNEEQLDGSFLHIDMGTVIRSALAIIRLDNIIDYTDRFPIGIAMLMIVELNNGRTLILNGRPRNVEFRRFSHLPDTIKIELIVDTLALNEPSA